MTVSDALPVLLVTGLIFISTLAILRRNGAGESESQDWGVLLRERDMWRDLAIYRGEQLARAGIPPILASEMETLAGLAQEMEAKFSLDEMRTLALSVGINPDTLAHDTSSELARELVMSANRRSRLERLVAEMQRERPA